MTDRELMQQALDALTYKKWWRVGLGEPKDPKLEAAITSVNERLAHFDRCGKKLGGEGDIHTCTPPAAQPAMFGPMGTVGALFDKHVIGRLDKNWRVYVEKNT